MRKQKREVTRSELQAEITNLRNKNRELFKFLQIERQRAAEQVKDAKEGVQETMLAMNLVLGEVTRKYGEVTIRMPDIANRQFYNVERDKEAGTMTFRPIANPAETAENGAEDTAESAEEPGNTKESCLPETKN